MKIAVAVLIGCIFILGQNATSSTVDSYNDRSIKRTEEDYVPVAPGARIYFHVVNEGKLLFGPRIKSDGIVTIHTLQDDEKFHPANQKPLNYSVLKSGVLVPKSEGTCGKVNENVYKTREAVFYVKGFRDILIPIDVLYPKSKQKAIVDSEAFLAKTFAETCGSDEEAISQPGKTLKSKKAWKIVERLRQKPKDFKPKEEDRTGVVGRLTPDKNCNGEITMFVLRSDGVLERMPPDPYLPMGIKLSYTLKDNFLIRPRILENSGDLAVDYFTGKNGDLVPNGSNQFKVRTGEGEYVTFILGECGSLIPVQEVRDKDEDISYHYNGQLIYKGQQFPEIFSNSEFILVNDRKHKLPDKKVTKKKHSIRKRALISEDFLMSGPSQNFYPQARHDPMLPPVRPTPIMRPGNVMPPMQQVIRQQPTMIVRQPPGAPPMHHHHSVGFEPSFTPIAPPPIVPPPIVPPPPPVAVPMQTETVIPDTAIVPVRIPAPPIPCDTPRIRVRTDLFVEDENGLKIPLIPELTEQNDVVLYKLTCKGHLVRFPSCKEPDFGFEIHFQMLLDEFILVPTTDTKCEVCLTYVLQENGDLIPLESNENTFKKAPGSLLYFMLGKNNILFPINQKVDMEGGVTFYYQDYHLLKLPNTANKPLHFSTFGRPLFAYFNEVTVITVSSKPRLKPHRGSNWKSHCSKISDEGNSKDIFLSGPKGELIRITPFKTKTGSTVIYEMDSNGILYRSPKDKKRCIILKTYILLKEGILLPSNDTSGYMYMTSKNGDMFPYIYPDGKLEAPQGESFKYLLCEKGILLPVELEVVDNYICYFFRDVIVYKEKVYSKDTLKSVSRGTFTLNYRTDCTDSGKLCDRNCKGGFKPFTSTDGQVVYYEKVKTLLKRHPSEAVPPSLSYTMGSFEIQPDGSLFQIRYQDPDSDVINLMLEPNGDLLEDNRNVKCPQSNYYILDVNGNLIAVEARKTRKSIYFYKNHLKVCRVRIPEKKCVTHQEVKTDLKKTPLGLDPLNLMEQPEPRQNGFGPVYIPVPLKSVVMPDPEVFSCSKCGKDSCDKCKAVKETMALELEINDEVIEEIKNWAAKCDKLLSRREVEQSLTNALKGLNVAGLLNSNSTKTR